VTVLRLVVTRNGRPFALVVGIENKDQEDLQLEASSEFWQMIGQRRLEPTVRLRHLKAGLIADSE